MKTAASPPSPAASAVASSRGLQGLRVLVQVSLLSVALLAFRQQQQVATSCQFLKSSSELQALQPSQMSDISTSTETLKNQIQELQEQNSQLKHELEQEVQPSLNKTANKEEWQETPKQDKLNSSGPISPSPPAAMVQSPFRLHLSTQELRLQQNYTSPACTIQADDGQVFNRIVFLHNRKAGGTSVRHFVRDVAKKNQIPVWAEEGEKEVEYPGTYNKTLYITHLREPISRTISHFKYEKRWNCETQLRDPDFVPTENNTQMDLMTFAKKRNRPWSKFWVCSQECFARWATAWWQDGSLDDPPKLESWARKVLGGYHLIIISEWLKYPEYARSIEAIFGVSGIDRKSDMICGPAANRANKAVPLNVTQEHLDLIASLNRVDIKLYNEFSTCSHGPQFGHRRIQFEPYSVPEGEEPAPMNYVIVDVGNRTSATQRQRH